MLWGTLSGPAALWGLIFLTALRQLVGGGGELCSSGVCVPPRYAVAGGLKDRVENAEVIEQSL